MRDPVRGGAVEKLLDMVNGAVTRAVSATPDLAASYRLLPALNQSEPDIVLATSSVDFLRAISSVAAQPADLEIAQRTLAIVDDIVRQLGPVNQTSDADGREALQIYADLMHHLANRLSDLGGSRNALSVAEEVLSNFRRIIQFKLPPRASRGECELVIEPDR
jgi:hypothetical protein